MFTDKTCRIDEGRRDNRKLFHYTKVSSGMKFTWKKSENARYRVYKNV